MEQELAKRRLRKLKQGFSIDELNAGAYSDDSENESDAELNYRDDEDNRSDDTEEEALVSRSTMDVCVTGHKAEKEQVDDLFLDDNSDAKNELWVKNHFEKDSNGGEKVLICCPSCFVPVSYLSKPEAQFWVAEKVVNCVVASSSQDAPVVSCAECGMQIGKRRRADGKFLFQGVLPSSSSDQL